MKKMQREVMRIGLSVLLLLLTCATALTTQQLKLEQSMPEDEERLGNRVKRKVFNFDIHPHRKWPLPIKYIIDSSLTVSQANDIHRIIREDFMGQTCIQFISLTSPPDVNEQYIRFRLNTDNSSCFSEIGRDDRTDTVHGQPIYLGSDCFNARNGILYTISSTLGMLNEMNRPDRDNYIRLERDHIDEEDLFNFAIHSLDYFSIHDIPYDYGSLMQAAPNRGLKAEVLRRNASALTLVPLDGAYMYTAGQFAELSFYDILALNRAYCNGTCRARLNCQNGGYTDPNTCSRCRCPPGFSGTYCTEHPSGAAGCMPSSGVIQVTSQEEMCLESPGFADNRYRIGDNCTWRLSAPPSRLIDLWFTELNLLAVDMSVYATCLHYVEVKSRGPEQPRGTRYCQNENRNRLQPYFVQEAVVPMTSDYLTTRSNDVMLIFRTPRVNNGDRVGNPLAGKFRLCYRLSEMTIVDLEPLTSTTLPTPGTDDSGQPGPAQAVASEDGGNTHIYVIAGTVGVVLLVLVLLFAGLAIYFATRGRRKARSVAQTTPLPPPDASYNAGAASVVVVHTSDIDLQLAYKKQQEEEAEMAAIAESSGGADTPGLPAYSENDLPPQYHVNSGSADTPGYENASYETINGIVSGGAEDSVRMA